MSFFNEVWDGLQGGFLRKPLKKMTGMTDAQMLGAAGLAIAAPYALPSVMGAAGTAGATGATAGTAGATAGTAGAQGGLLSTFSQYAQPASQVMNIASQARGLSQGQPMQAPQAQFAQGPGFGGLLNPTDQVDPRKRQQAQQMAVQGLLGGYGRNYG